MSAWNSLTLNFDPFAPILPPLKSILTVLETVQAILEVFIGILKAFLLDLTNILKSIFMLLLAAIRAIISQIIGGTLGILLVHPDFSQQDFAGVLNSVAGGYPTFQSK